MGLNSSPVRQESASGWLRLGVGTFLILVLPIWSILTASFLQADPFEEILIADRDGSRVVMQAPLWSRLVVAGAEAGIWIVVFLGILGAATAVWWVLGRRRRTRTLVEHARYAAQSPVDVDFGVDDWEVTIHKRIDPTEAMGQPKEDDKIRPEAPTKEPPVR